MKHTLTLLCAAALLSLTGCAAIDKATTSEATLLDKAELATGIEASQLSVVPGSVQGTLDAVEYKVQTKKGRVYRCYYTSMVAVKSDALCTAISKDGQAQKAAKTQKALKKTTETQKTTKQSKPATESSSECNALLRAAGRC